MKELLEIYTEDGKETGKSEDRDIVHKEGIWHKVIHIWIINSKGEVLIQKRSNNKDTKYLFLKLKIIILIIKSPGCWDVSVGGHISFGETSKEAALKELSEE
jgi:isopentenyl-diphosphate delta-isomerase